MTRQEIIALYNEHATQRGDIPTIPMKTKLNTKRLAAKLAKVEDESESWTDLPHN